MKRLFDTTTINGLEIPNRIVRSATWEGMCAPDGQPTQRLADLYGRLARGGVGLIICGFAFVRADGRQMPGMMGMHQDEVIDAAKTLTESVHQAGVPICAQLVHAGGQTDSATIGRPPLAPSALEAGQFSEIPEALSIQEIEQLVGSFVDAANRAKSCGFDAVQLHGAHGYLINQFLSPHLNKRTDEYGGTIENRCRFLMEVYKGVRAVLGQDYPVMIKLNGSDFLDNGLTIDDAVFAAKLLAEEGIDAIEVSGGTRASGNKSPARMRIKSVEQEGYHLPLGQRIKGAVACPVMVVGGFRSVEIALEAIEAGNADYIAMSRPLIREPDLALRWRSGDTARAKCISCNGCFKPGMEEGGIYCVVEAKERQKE